MVAAGLGSALAGRPMGRLRVTSPESRWRAPRSSSRVLVLDTGPLLAALDSRDPDHDACASLITSAREDLVVPALVLAELDYWCHERLTSDVWLSFLEDALAGVYVVASPTLRDLERCLEVQAQYKDLEVGIVDASVLALVERLGESKLATLDHRHFRALQPVHTQSLILLPDDRPTA